MTFLFPNCGWAAGANCVMWVWFVLLRSVRDTLFQGGRWTFIEWKVWVLSGQVEENRKTFIFVQYSSCCDLVWKCIQRHQWESNQIQNVSQSLSLIGCSTFPTISFTFPLSPFQTTIKYIDFARANEGIPFHNFYQYFLGNRKERLRIQDGFGLSVNEVEASIDQMLLIKM